MGGEGDGEPSEREVEEAEREVVGEEDGEGDGDDGGGRDVVGGRPLREKFPSDFVERFAEGLWSLC